MACSIMCFWWDGNISSLVRYSYLSILPDDQADNCSFSYLIWSFIYIDLLYIYFKRLFLNLKGFPDRKVVSLTKKQYDSAVYFL